MIGTHPSETNNHPRSDATSHKSAKGRKHELMPQTRNGLSQNGAPLQDTKPSLETPVQRDSNPPSTTPFSTKPTTPSLLIPNQQQLLFRNQPNPCRRKQPPTLGINGQLVIPNPTPLAPNDELNCCACCFGMTCVCSVWKLGNLQIGGVLM